MEENIYNETKLAIIKNNSKQETENWSVLGTQFQNVWYYGQTLIKSPCPVLQKMMASGKDKDYQFQKVAFLINKILK